jgi:glutaredoxin
MKPKITLYGTETCHKTQYYKQYLKDLCLEYKFLDVVLHQHYAEALRSLYKNRGLNFPTVTIGKKKLRNPSDKDLKKWIEKLL